MRKYNRKISERANESLKKREVVVRRQRRILAIAVIIIISLGILLGTGMNALASSKADVASFHKYYTSVRVEAGDTLWDMVDVYIDGLNIDKESYILEVCQLNGIYEDDIHAGDYVIFPYYSKEVK